MPVLPDTSAISIGHYVLQKRLAVSLPAYQSKNDMNPTLLVSWFCTIVSLFIINVRLLGRWIRNEKLFSEDKVMFWSIVPLLGRMGLVHVILIWGTNNTVTEGLSEVEIQHRIIGSKLVLPARILFATYIWIAKVTVLEFLEKLVTSSWHKSYMLGMRAVYGFLAVTYVAVVISTLAGCQPFNHYWQVIPDPGTACRAGTVQLITMGVCEVLTDLVLVILPIPLVLGSRMALKRKVSLISLFLLSLILVAIALFRIPSTIHRGASQQYRSLLASLEILASTAVANAIVIGSFLRDKGVKKARFRAASAGGSTLSRVPTQKTTRSRSIAKHHWGSDEDLVRDMGLCVPTELRHGAFMAETSRLPPVAEVVSPIDGAGSRSSRPNIDANWNFGSKSRHQRRKNSHASSSSSLSTNDIKLHELQSQMDEPVSPGANSKPHKLSFFETGETLDSPPVSRSAPQNYNSSKSHTFLSDVGGLLGSSAKQDDEISVVPTASQRGQSSTSLNPDDSRSFLPTATAFKRGSNVERNDMPQPQWGNTSPSKSGPKELDFVDVGGLLK